MLSQTTTCPACKASFDVKGPSPAGITATKCPKCGAKIPPIPHTNNFPSIAGHFPISETAFNVSEDSSRDEQTALSLILNAPPGPRAVTEFPFLAPAKQPDELGRLGSYRVLDLLGAGGMGAVFRAEDPVLRRQIALKVMLPQFASNPTAIARFLREARAQAAVEHDHIIAIHQVGQDRNVPFIAMPLLKGQTLSKALKANPMVPIGEAVRIAREIAEGLAAAHEHSLVHRDIKPANVWLEGRQRRVKLLDFGLARAEADASGSDAVTQEGAIVGTPAYMSPEQAQGETVDARTDLFSLGVVLYQMLAGRQPFTGKSTTAILMSVVSNTPASPATLNPQVPADLDALTMRLLAKSVEDRPANAEEVVEVLRAVESGQNLTAQIPVVYVPAAVADPWESIANTVQDSEPAAKPFEPVVPRTRASHGTGSSRSKSRPWLLVASLLAFVAVVVATAEIIIKIKNKDGSVTEIKAPDDATVTVTKNGKEVAKVGPDGKKGPGKMPSGPIDDRAAAEWTLGLGGWVSVNGQENEINAVASLPKEPFRLTSIYLTNKQVSDADLAYFKECKNLTVLSLGGTQVTDTGLAAFKECKNLTHLYLGGTQVSDAGLANFKDCKNLTLIVLDGTRVSDAGLAAFKDCKNLTYLNLYGTQVSDKGLVAFKDCKNLTYLNLYGTQVSDAGLANFKDFKNLTYLDLGRTQVSDVGLAHFKDCKDLTHLALNHTQVSDAGLAYFKECQNLTYLDLNGTQVGDVGLAHFEGCKNLTNLVLQSTRVGDKGLAYFKDCKNLTGLGLHDTQVGDAGLANFKDCKDLIQLYLGGTKVTNVGLANFKDCKNLRDLRLGGTQVSDMGLIAFKDCNNLARLELGGTQVTDVGLAHFKHCKTLMYLDARNTKVTSEIIDDLQKALPQCKIEWDGGIEPKTK